MKVICQESLIGFTKGKSYKVARNTRRGYILIDDKGREAEISQTGFIRYFRG